MGRLAVLAVAVVLVVAGAGWRPPASGLIVFPAVATGQTTAQLYSIEPSGAGLRQLTTGTAAASAPALSPSGRRVAFALAGKGIYTMAADGTGLRRLTANGRDAAPAWSPTGRQLVFLRPVGQFWRLFVVRSTGGAPVQVPLAASAGRPTWTGAGLLVPTGADLLRLDPASGRRLQDYHTRIDANLGPNGVAIAPDGRRLTFVGTRGASPGDDQQCGDGPCQYGLFLERFGATTTAPKPIVAAAGPATFSPDGTRVAFVLDGAVTVRTLAGGAQVRLDTPGITPLTSTPLAWR
ncbi:MAG: hypothetical protein ABUS54_01455 [Actinomycetota bacterium]